MTITTAVSAPDMTQTGSELLADAYFKWLCCASQEVAAAFGGYGLLSGRSDTSLTIATGTNIFVLKEDSAFAKGMYVKATYARNEKIAMSGIVTDYVSGTKTLTVSVEEATAIGDTYALWIIHPAAKPKLSETTNDEIRLEGGSGNGSTNTKIRIFTTVVVNTGASMTYADSATLGASITINETGWYSVTASDKHVTGTTYFGVTKNTASPTTTFATITDKAEVLALGSMISGGGQTVANAIVLLTAGDVIRHHGNGSAGTSANEVYLWVRRLA